MRRSFTARRFLVWRFREVGTRQRCELKRRYDTSIKLNRLKCRPDVLLTYIHIAGVYWNTLINDVCFFLFRWVGGVPLKPRSFHVMFHPNGSPRQQLRLASRPLLYLVFWVLPGGIGGETSTGWRWRFPGENVLTKSNTPWMIVPSDETTPLNAHEHICENYHNLDMTFRTAKSLAELIFINLPVSLGK